MLSIFNISTLHSLSCRLSTCTGWLCSKTTCTPPTQTMLTCSPKPVWSGWTASTAQTTKWWPGWTRGERCTSTTRDASPQVGSTQHVHKQAHICTSYSRCWFCCYYARSPVRSHACEVDQFGKAGGCSDICLLGNGHKTRTCRCRSGFSLGSDGKSCKSKKNYKRNVIDKRRFQFRLLYYFQRASIRS